MTDLAQKAAEITPRNIGGLSRGKIVFGSQSDEEILDILRAQLEDPGRNTAFDSELQREMSLVQRRMGFSGVRVAQQENVVTPPPIAQEAPAVSPTSSLITGTEAEQRRLMSVGQTPIIPSKESPSFSELLSAGIKSQNIIGSAGQSFAAHLERLRAQQLARFEGSEDPNYDPFENIKGYEVWSKEFINANSVQEVEAIKRRIDSEMEVRRTLDEGGLLGLAAVVSAGVLSPEQWIPGSVAVVRSWRRGEDLVRGLAKGAAVGTAFGVASEAGLHATQVTRTAEESTWTIGSSALLMGILGGTASQIGRRGIEALSGSVKKDLTPPPHTQPDPRVEPNSAVPLETTGSAGAMRVQEPGQVLKGALGVEKLVGPVYPGMRTAMSPEVEVRRASSLLKMQPFYTLEHAEGIPAPISAEANVIARNADLVAILERYEDNYASYASRTPKAQRLTKDEFLTEITIAGNRNDKHAIAEVADAARFSRERGIDPITKDAVATKLLKEEQLKVSHGQSYWSYIWNPVRVAAERTRLVKIITDYWTQGDLARANAVRAENEALAKAGKSTKEVPFTDPLEVQEAAEQAVTNILGTSDGRTFYGIIPSKRGMMKDRTLDMPFDLISDFLETDASLVMKTYFRTMVPDIEIARNFGDVNMTDALRKIDDAYKDKVRRATTEKERASLERHRKDDVRDLKAMRDDLRGTYAAPQDPSSFMVRLGQGMREVNYMGKMGMVVESSIPDIANPVIVHGVMAWMRDGIIPMISNFRSFRLSAREAKLAGAITEGILDSRAKSMADIGDSYGRYSKFERGLHAVSHHFGNWSLINAWNTAMKSFASVLTQHFVLQAAVAGQRSAKQIEKLARLTISPEMAGRIAAEFRKHGERGTVWLANTEKWTDLEAVRHYRAAIIKDVDNMIVTPRIGDRPLMTSGEVGKLVFQFRSFAFATVPRILVSGLQQRDMATLNGVMLSMFLGMTVYALRQKHSGKPLSDDPGTWIREGIDRSGLLGWLYDTQNIVEKVTGGRVGLRALTGGEVSSRYVDRDITDAIAGPSIGMVGDIARTGRMLTDAAVGDDVSRSDVRAARRLVPFQNVFYLRWLFDKAQEGAEEAFGATNARRQ